MHHVISWLCYTYERNKLAREFETSTGVDSPCGAVAVMASAVSSEWLHEVLMYCLTLSREQREIGPLCAGRLLEHRFKAHIPRNLPRNITGGAWRPAALRSGLRTPPFESLRRQQVSRPPQGIDLVYSATIDGITYRGGSRGRHVWRGAPG